MYVVIMCGGSGKRFWPKSRESNPKQFLDLTGRGSMLRCTFERALKIADRADIFVVTHERFAKKVKEDVPQILSENIIAEPQAKNTAPCMALSLFYLKRFRGPGCVLFLPADHLIGDCERFAKIASIAGKRAQTGGGLVVFGIKPRYAETGYGYVQKGAHANTVDGEEIFKVERFTEKPDQKRAKEFLESGGYLWNSGMFLFTMERLENSFKNNLPKMYEKFSSLDFGQRGAFSADTVRSLYGGIESVSVDYGLMEKESGIEAVQCDFDWSDVGNWRALEEIWPADAAKNNIKGLSFAKEAHGIIADTGGKMLVALGAKDLIIVDTKDVIFVCSKERVDGMKEMLDEMEKAGLKKYL